jgi:hypothetical protein
MKFKSYSFGGSSIVYKLLVIIGFALSLSACQWGDEIESLAQPNPDDFAVLLSDTVTIQLSTIGSDSVMTGGPSRMLFGTYKDPYFGKVRTANFFQPTTEGAVTVAQDAEYDSLILQLKYDKYSYGDTTKPMNLSVYKVLTDIMEKSSYWNHQTLPYDPTAIGKITLLPRPVTTGSIKIRLSDVLGKQIFQMAKNNELTSSVDWINTLKGLVMIPAATDNGPIVGFQMGTNVDSTTLQLHYHTPLTSEFKKDSTLFEISRSFNQIIADPTGTQLTKLPVNKRIALPSSESGNMAFMQAGTGVMMRVDLPYLKHFKYTQYTAINKALLRIRPLRASVTDVLRVPPVLYIYRVDKNNQFYTDGNGMPLPLYTLVTTQAQQVGSRYIRDLINNDEYYLFDISAYATEIMSSETGDAGGLVIRSSPFGSGGWRDGGTEYAMSVDRLVVGNKQHANPGVDLQLFYTRVKPK